MKYVILRFAIDERLFWMKIFGLLDINTTKQSRSKRGETFNLKAYPKIYLIDLFVRQCLENIQLCQVFTLICWLYSVFYKHLKDGFTSVVCKSTLVTE